MDHKSNKGALVNKDMICNVNFFPNASNPFRELWDF